MKLIIAIGVLICFVHIVYTTDYCKVNCFGRPHVACNVTDTLQSNCPKNASIYKFNQSEIDYILHLHNDFRNAICNGSMPGFESCKLMAKMTWENELAYLAGINTRNCTFGHDKCRNTAKYQNSGQNLGSVAIANQYPAATTVIKLSIHNMWFNEYSHANMTYINRFKLNPDFEIAHFTQLIWANATTVGCGATRYFKDGNGVFYFACNYATGNINGASVYYSSQKGGSGCTTGTDKTYKSLCSEKESFIVR